MDKNSVKNMMTETKDHLMEQSYKVEHKEDKENIDVDVGGDDDQIDEPVSPPPCPLEEAPQILLQPNNIIEELAVEVVDESRSLEQDIPVTLSSSSSTSSSSSEAPMIPLTVTENNNDHTNDNNSGAASLHMSGGGVYTTDSFFYTSPMKTVKKTETNTKQRSSVITKAPKLKPSDNLHDKLDNLLEFYGNNSAEDEQKNKVLYKIVQPTIKLSDSLEITPITVRSVSVAGKTQDRKRKHDSLMQEIPRITDDSTTEISQNDNSFNCRLIIPKNTTSRKVTLMFENGQNLQLNRNLFKNIKSGPVPNIRRKSVKSRNPPMKSSKSFNQRLSKMLEESVLNDQSSNSDSSEGNSNSETPTHVKSMENENNEKSMKNTTTTDNSEIPAGQNIGLHKLPSIVCKPTHHVAKKMKKS